MFNYKVDLIFEKNTLKTIKKIKKRHGKIDLIICCVGSGKSVSAGKENKKSWDKSLSINFFSATNLIESYLSVYKNKKTKIILISSIAGLKIIDAPITYSVAKAALNYYGKMKSKHLAKYNINLNIISPGNILQRKNVWDKKMKKDNLSIKRKIEFIHIKDDTDLSKTIDELNILVCYHIEKEIFIKATNMLQWIHCGTAGVEHIMHPEIIKSKVIITNARGIHATPIAEYVLGVMLYLAKQFDSCQDFKNTKNWNQWSIVKKQLFYSKNHVI